MEVRPARPEDLPTYQHYARQAQAWLKKQGLAQYIPAAHDLYATAFAARIEAGTLFAAWVAGVPLAFFFLDAKSSPWWPPDGVAALYFGGMVVAPKAQGQGIGTMIIQWCASEASRRGCTALRLDCHAGNPWLGRYYERHSFRLRGHVEQQPGYTGCLYELALASEEKGPS